MRTPIFSLVALLAGCLPNDDAGDVAFVSHAVPAVLGRKVHGAVELDVLTQIAQTYGRGTLVDVLMDQPEFETYWTQVLATDLEAQSTYNGQGVGSWAQDTGCFDQALYMQPGDLPAAGQLATFLADPSSTGGFGAPYTMLDAIRAGVLHDNLFAPYRVWLFAVASHSGDNPYFAEKFFNSSYLGRDQDCMSCHSSTWSTTDADPANTADFDRFWPMPFDVEGGLYQAAATPPTACGADANCQVFEKYCSGCHGIDGSSLVRNGSDGDAKRLAQRVRVISDPRLRGAIDNGFGNMPRIAVSTTQREQIVEYLRRTFGQPDALEFYLRSQTLHGGTDQPLGLATVCSVPINGTTSVGVPAVHPAFAGIAPATPSALDVSRRLAQGATIPPVTFLAGTNFAWDNRPYDAPLVSSAGVLGYATAQHVVDNVVEEVWGEKETIGHGVERVATEMLDRASFAGEFVGRGWSLRYLVRALVMSNLFNQRAPADSLVTSFAYHLPMSLNPWAAVQTGKTTGAPGENSNGQGDAVHRYSPDNLLNSVHYDLGWNAPKVMAESAAFPSYAMREGIGDYMTWYQPGYTRWHLGGLLEWEAEVGLCPVGNSDSGDDWVAMLLADGYAAPDAYTIRDLLSATRDRLLGSPSFASGEESALLALFPAVGLPAYGTLAVPLTGITQGQVEPVLRRYCGALLTTPDYLLGGIPRAMTLPTSWPALQTCLPGEPCGVADTCAYWRDALADEGVTWSACDTTPPRRTASGSGGGHHQEDPPLLTTEDQLAADFDVRTASTYDDEVEANLAEEERLRAEEDAQADALQAEEDAREEEDRAAGEAWVDACRRDSACDEVEARWRDLSEVERGRAKDRASAVPDVPTWAYDSPPTYAEWVESAELRGIQEEIRAIPGVAEQIERANAEGEKAAEAPTEEPTPDVASQVEAARRWVDEARELGLGE